MIAKIRLEGIVDGEAVRQLSEYLGEEIKTRRIHLGTDSEVSVWSDIPEEEMEPDKFYLDSTKEYVTDATAFLVSFPELETRVKPIKLPAQTLDDMSNKLEIMANKIENILGAFDKDMQFNSKCEVHVPNLGLLNINNLAYANDYCTERLQGKLNEGWRILAICPQPNQRRPDYVLGRFIEGCSDNTEVYNF